MIRRNANACGHNFCIRHLWTHSYIYIYYIYIHYILYIYINLHSDICAIYSISTVLWVRFDHPSFLGLLCCLKMSPNFSTQTSPPPLNTRKKPLVVFPSNHLVGFKNSRLAARSRSQGLPLLDTPYLEDHPRTWIRG